MAGDAARILNPLELTGPRLAGQEDLLTPAALGFLIDLHRAFEPERQARLAARRQRQARFDAGELPSGIYLYRVQGKTFTATRQMTLLK